MSNPMPFQDRRQADRRSADRQGKYDRRKNRCGSCVLFQAHAVQAGSPEGLCAHFGKPIPPDAFACPYFESA